MYVGESEEEVELCAQLVGTLQYDIEINLSSVDITAIGIIHNTKKCINFENSIFSSHFSLFF